MRLDVYLTPGEVLPADVMGRTVVVLDILRATTSMVQALSAGAKSIYPVASIEEALRLAKTFGRDEVLLCGERKCLPIEGFDLGNSPREFTSERVSGKTLVMTTTNGTAAFALTGGASRVLVGSLLNLGALVEELVRSEGEPVLICAGRERHFGLDDATCAGLLARRLIEAKLDGWRLNDGALSAMTLADQFGVDERMFRQTAAGRLILDAGLDKDLAFCARIDTLDVLPVLHERKIVLSPPTSGA
jgi:2-phosphosulfolactate phosphatase